MCSKIKSIDIQQVHTVSKFCKDTRECYKENNGPISENALSTISEEGQYRGRKLSDNNAKC